MNIIFFGSPGFAVSSLEKLYDSTLNIQAVVTAPDRPSGRGLKISKTEVKKFAELKNIPVLQPEKLKNAEFLSKLKNYKSDLFIVVAFRMLPAEVWKIPRKGTINLHASLLPDYRGAAPINWAIINGETKTGLTTFFINEKIDTGDLLLKQEVEINHLDTAGTLHDKLAVIGADLLLKTVFQIESNTFQAQAQLLKGNEKKAPKLNRSICRIDWQKDAKDLFNQIRGLSPYPAAWALLNGKVCKIYAIHFQPASHSDPIGLIVSDNKSYLKVAVHEGYIYINSLQIEGKKRLDVSEFLKGYTLTANEIMR